MDDCLEALKFIPDWYVTSKMLEKFNDTLNTNDDIRFLMKILGKSNFFLIKSVFVV